jgi:hypothetical protein
VAKGVNTRLAVDMLNMNEIKTQYVLYMGKSEHQRIYNAEETGTRWHCGRP